MHHDLSVLVVENTVVLGSMNQDNAVSKNLVFAILTFEPHTINITIGALSSTVNQYLTKRHRGIAVPKALFL